MKRHAILLIENKAAVSKEFNRIALRYDLATSLSQGYQQDLNRSAALLELKGSERVLDLCCGTGKSALAILPHLPSGIVIGVDNAEEMLAVARTKFAQEIAGGRMRLHLGDAMNLTFPDDSFDAIFMAYGLRNMPDLSQCLEGLHRILRPGGKLVVHEYSLSHARCARSFWLLLGYLFIVPFCSILTGSSRIFSYLVKSVLRFPAPIEVQALLEQTGFVRVTVHRHPSWRRLVLHTFRAKKALPKDLPPDGSLAPQGPEQDRTPA